MTTGSPSSTANCSVAFRSSATVGSCSSLDASPRRRKAGTAHNNVICMVAAQYCQIFINSDFWSKGDRPWSFWTQTGAPVGIGCICNWWCVSCQMKEAQPTLLPLWLTDELGKQKDIKPVSWCKRHLLEQISGSPSLSRRWAQMQSSSYLGHQSRHLTRTKGLKEGTAVATKCERESQFWRWNPARCTETGTGGSGVRLPANDTKTGIFLFFFSSELKYFAQHHWQNPGSSAWAVFEASLWSESFYRDTSSPLRLGYDIPEGHPRIVSSFSSFKVFAASFMSTSTVHLWPPASCFLALFFTKGR